MFKQYIKLNTFLFLSLITTQRATAKKALFFFSSDVPHLLPQVSRPFLRRLNREKVFTKAEENFKLTREWLKRGKVSASASSTLNEDIKQATEKVKNLYFSGMTQKAAKLVNTSYKTFTRNMASHYGSSNAFPEFLLWSAVTSFDNKVTFRQYARHYSFATDAKTALKIESDISPRILSAIYETGENTKFHTLNVVSHKKCRIFLSGKQIQKKSIKVPQGLPISLASACTDGYWGEVLRLYKDTKVAVLSSLPRKYYEMPSPETLTKADLRKGRVHHDMLAFFHWGSCDAFVEIAVYNPRNMQKVGTRKFPLVSDEDLDSLGDRTVEYLRGVSRKL